MQYEASPLDTVIGENVRTWRVERGLTQEELAERVAAITGGSFRQQTVLRTEQGVRPLRFAEAAAIAQVLGVPTGTLAEPTRKAPAQQPYEVHRQAIEREVENVAPALLALGEAYESLDTALTAVWNAVTDVPEEELEHVFVPEQWQAVAALVSPDHREQLRDAVTASYGETALVHRLGAGFVREFQHLTPVFNRIDKRQFNVERETFEAAAARQAAGDA